MPWQVHASVVGEADPFTPKALLHHVWAVEMSPAREGAEAIHDAMTREPIRACTVQRPPHRSGGASDPQMGSDMSVRRDTSVRDLRHDREDAFEEITAFIHTATTGCIMS